MTCRGNHWEEPMRLALAEARVARKSGEVPVGAVVLDRTGALLAAAHNRTLTAQDPAGHAEILALREAAIKVGNHRLTGCVMVVTVEPCLMCLGALIQARVAGLVIGAREAKTGAVLSRININDLDWLNHRFWVIEGVLAGESSSLLVSFFVERRKFQIPTSASKQTDERQNQSLSVPAITGEVPKWP